MLNLLLIWLRSCKLPRSAPIRVLIHKIKECTNSEISERVRYTAINYMD